MAGVPGLEEYMEEVVLGKQVVVSDDFVVGEGDGGEGFLRGLFEDPFGSSNIP